LHPDAFLLLQVEKGQAAAHEWKKTRRVLKGGMMGDASRFWAKLMAPASSETKDAPNSDAAATPLPPQQSAS